MFQFSEANKILKFANLSKIDIVWSFDPFRFQNMNLWNAKYNIFHAVDVHKTNLDILMARSANLIIACSDLILKKFETLPAKKIKINHGIADYFLSSNRFEKKSASPHQLCVGWVGNLHHHFIDWHILMKIVSNHPNIKFYFVGPADTTGTASPSSENIKNLERLNNVYLLGRKRAEEVPDFLCDMDVLLICYKGDKQKTAISNSHKILEYLSSGQPVISSFFDEYKKSKEIFMSINNNDLPGLFSNITNHLEDYNTAEMKSKRISLAHENSYRKQIERIENSIPN